MLHRITLIFLLFALLLPPEALARGREEKALPRFASLRQDEVNVRTGPGTQYPIEWIYTRRGLPVEIVDEFEAWRRIRDWDGTEGWVHVRALGGKRALIVTGEKQPVFSLPDEASPVAATVEGGVPGAVLECPEGSSFCRIGIGSVEGWMKKFAFYGVYLDETVAE